MSSTATAFTVRSLWDRLLAEGLVRGDPPTLEPPAPRMPIIGRLLMGFLGWLSGVFLLLALVGPFFLLFEWKLSLWVIGAGLVFLASRLFTAAKKVDFIEHFALSLSVAGQFALLFGFVNTFAGSLSRAETTLIALFCLAMQVGLLLLIDNPMQRFMSALFGWLAISVLLFEAKIAFAFPAFLAAIAAGLWLAEARAIASGRDPLLRPIAYASWSLLLVVCAMGFTDLFKEERWLNVQSTPGLALVLVIVVGVLSRRLSYALRAGVLFASLIFVAASYGAPGLIACTIAFVVAYARGHARAAVIALAFSALYLFAYYYQTNTTLLEKSMSLTAVAAALAIFAFVLSRISARPEVTQ